MKIEKEAITRFGKLFRERNELSGAIEHNHAKGVVFTTRLAEEHGLTAVLKPDLEALGELRHGALTVDEWFTMARTKTDVVDQAASIRNFTAVTDWQLIRLEDKFFAELCRTFNKAG